MRILPFKASLQLRKVLNRLEEEEGEKQEALKKRVEEERGKLEATMGFSRAAAVAALAQEVKPWIIPNSMPLANICRLVVSLKRPILIESGLLFTLIFLAI